MSSPITLSDGVTVLDLPYDLIHVERNGSPVDQAVTRSVTGKLIVMSAARDYGEPITLESPPRGGWMRFSTELIIRQWAAEADKTLTLDLRGAVHAVQFRHHEPPAYQSEPVRYLADPTADDWVIPTLKFFTVEA